MTSIRHHLDKLSDAQLKELQRGVYRKSLFHTAKYLCQYPHINWDTHGEMINALESLEFGQAKGALIVMPRGSLKSSVSSVAFPIWLLIRDPNKRIMLDSAVYDLSSQFLNEISQHLEARHVVDLFGEFRTRDDWSSKSLTIKQRTKILKEGSVVASGVGSPKTGAHFDVIISDDLNNQKNSNTPELREGVWKHWQMSHAILEPEGFEAVVATRYSADDVPGRILETQFGKDMLPDYLKAR